MVRQPDNSGGYADVGYPPVTSWRVTGTPPVPTSVDNIPITTADRRVRGSPAFTANPRGYVAVWDGEYRRETTFMNLTGKIVRRGVGGALAAGFAVAVLAAPSAAAEPCRADAATATISQVSGAASQYLASHPGANDTLSNALSQPRDQATTTVRNYFMANPGEYFDLRNITAPLQTLRNQCGTSFAGSDLIAAFDEFQMG